MSDSPPETQTAESLEASPRFAPAESRRDWLGLVAICSALGTFVVALIGALRLPMPSVFPESQSRMKLGKPDAFPLGSTTNLKEASVWIVREEDGGMYALSAVCTHLGCVAMREEDGSFLCPCHGSVFEADGAVVAGPAPGGLPWLELSVSADGQIVVDKTRTVAPGTRLMLETKPV